jgi:hypothetical protein
MSIEQLMDFSTIPVQNVRDFNSDTGALYLVAEREKGGKSTFVDRDFLEEAGHLSPDGVMVTLETSYAHTDDENTLVLNRAYIPYGTSLAAKEKLQQEWVLEVTLEVTRRKPQVVVINEILDTDTVNLAVTLSRKGYTVFAVFPAFSSGNILSLFSNALKS